MKNLVKCFAVAAFAVWAGTSVTAEPLVQTQKECKNNTCESFRVGLYRVKDSLTMRFMLEKEKGSKVLVQLKDKNGKVLHRYFFGKAVTKTGRAFDFSEVQDGNYTLEISDAHEKIAKQIRLKTREVREVSGRTLVAMN